MLYNMPHTIAVVQKFNSTLYNKNSADDTLHNAILRTVSTQLDF